MDGETDLLTSLSPELLLEVALTLDLNQLHHLLSLSPTLTHLCSYDLFWRMRLEESYPCYARLGPLHQVSYREYYYYLVLIEMMPRSDQAEYLISRPERRRRSDSLLFPVPPFLLELNSDDKLVLVPDLIIESVSSQLSRLTWAARGTVLGLVPLPGLTEKAGEYYLSSLEADQLFSQAIQLGYVLTFTDICPEWVEEYNELFLMKESVTSSF